MQRAGQDFAVIRLLQGDLDGLLLAIADQAQCHLLVGTHGGNLGPQLAEGADGLAVDADDDVARLDAGLGGRRVRHHLVDEGAVLLVVAEGLGHFGGELGPYDAQLATADFTVFHDLFGQVAHHVGRNGKADTDVAAVGAQDGGVDADQLATQVEQGATRVARVDGRIGLDEVFQVLDVEAAAAERTDDAGGDGLAEAERVADGQRIVTDP